MTGVLKIRTTKEFGESTVSTILDLVENASSRKSRSEAFITNSPGSTLRRWCSERLLWQCCRPLVRMLGLVCLRTGKCGSTGL